MADDQSSFLEWFLDVDENVFLLYTKVFPNGHILRTEYRPVSGETSEDKFAAADLAEARAYREGVRNTIESLGYKPQFRNYHEYLSST